jgi:CheY-like chemotaxis protein
MGRLSYPASERLETIFRTVETGLEHLNSELPHAVDAFTACRLVCLADTESRGAGLLKKHGMKNQSAKILIVDDEAVDLAVMRRALESVGHTVVQATDYNEAVRLFDVVDGIDLVITDLSLPFKNGIELAHALVRRRPTLKVLFTSGWVGAEIMRSSGLTNAERFFLRKPFHIRDFISMVDRTLQSSDSFAVRERSDVASAAPES